jgi:hypothetical protein
MGCAAAPTQAPQLSRQKRASRFTTAAPPIARKRYSYTDREQTCAAPTKKARIAAGFLMLQQA